MLVMDDLQNGFVERHIIFLILVSYSKLTERFFIARISRK